MKNAKGNSDVYVRGELLHGVCVYDVGMWYVKKVRVHLVVHPAGVSETLLRT